MSDADLKQKEITCIICPNGCHVTVTQKPDGTLDIEGATCKRGVEYATDEFLSPTRMLITTMRIEDGELPVIPVRSAKPIPKGKIFDAMDKVNETQCKAPVKMGDVVIPNLLDTGIDVVVSRDMETKH